MLDVDHKHNVLDLQFETFDFSIENYNVDFLGFLRSAFFEKSGTWFDSYDLDLHFHEMLDWGEKGEEMSEKNQSSKTKFKDEYVWEAVSFAAASRKPITNVSFAVHKRVTEGTIRRWRKENTDFDRAFTDPEMMLANKINHGIIANMDKREKITVIKDKDGIKAIKEEVLPTHNDIMLATKNGFRKSMVGLEEQHCRETLKAIRARMQSGEISYLDALDECNEEGVAAPESWKARETARILACRKSESLSVAETAALFDMAGIAMPPALELEYKTSLGVSGDAEGVTIYHAMQVPGSLK